jgi:hypothetical protein
MLDSALESFLLTLKQEDGRAERTLSTYSEQILPFIRWLNGRAVTKPDEIKLTHVQAYLLSEQKRDKVSPGSKPGEKNSSATMAIKVAAIRGFLSHCVTERHMAEDFTELLIGPRPWKRQPKVLSREKIKQLLEPDATETPDSLCDQAVLELAYASGMRFAATLRPGPTTVPQFGTAFGRPGCLCSLAPSSLPPQMGRLQQTTLCRSASRARVFVPLHAPGRHYQQPIGGFGPSKRDGHFPL